jgi:DNA repair protein RecO (recombination protein O)
MYLMLFGVTGVYYRSNAIILKSIDYRESEKIVTIFTEKEGKIKAIAKGTKKPNSSLRACIQPFVNSFLYFSQGKNMDIITQGKVVDFFGNCREDLPRTLYCIYIMELLDKSLMEKVKLPELFRTTLQVLRYLDQSGYQPLVIRYFEMKLLIQLGYQPVLQKCANCEQKLSSYNYFSAAEGGVICDECHKNIEGTLPISGETLAIMKLLSNAQINVLERLKISDSAQTKLEQLLESYLEYHLERKFNLKNTIRRLKNITQL